MRLPLRQKEASAAFTAALALLACVFWLSYRNTARLREEAVWVQHTHAVIAEIRAVLVDLVNAETGQRGFLITGNEQFLEPYTTGLQAIPRHLESLRDLIRDNPVQQERLDRAERLGKERLDKLTRMVALRRQKGTEAVAQVIGTLEGKVIMDQVRSVLAEMEAEEGRLLVQRDRAVEAATARANLSLFAGALLSAALLVTVFVALSREIRDRKRAEDAVRASQVQLQAILDNASAVISVKDGEGRYLLVNRRYEELFRVARGGIAGKTVFDIFPPALAERFRANDRRVLESGAPLELEEVAPHDDGPHTYISTRFPLRDAAGRIYAVCAIGTDITDRKGREEAVRAAKEAAEAANRELEAFSYSVSHDLRAPLRGIDGFSQALLEDCAGALDDSGREHLRRIRGAAQRMSILIDDLLKLSRVSRSDLARQRVDLTAMAKEVAQDLGRREPARRVTFAIQDGLAAEGDPHLLRVALENLLGNAWKFTRKKPGARIDFGLAQENGTRAFCVRDDGAGFDMAYAAKLFTPFRRLHPVNEFEGTGIGLATVARVIQRHGGRMWAEGAVEKGAAFFFTLGSKG